MAKTKEESSKAKAVKDTKKEKESKKSTKEQDDSDNEGALELDYDLLVSRVSVIAKPLANKKLTKKVLKTVKKAAKAKQIRRGVKEVVKALKKKETGVVIIAGDISPIDVVAHIPVLCEEMSVPYVYVPSKEQLGAAGSTKRPTSVVLVKQNKDIKEAFDETVAEVKALPAPF
ncbi:nucleolar protein family A [Capsaspora owczarzaki ATCC 30864]|uniref:H/ACA ribonucleoprotein complex subunit 2 n=1 Tax=Capsaspora owczarzaki (strain ATCC 30864) TaxID=595528 RepID=A0A0D2WX27_CAPO3|nr:nucleolar protein family A [Capsaspora owczarzaki ATCC 30864]KJE97278.1 nucleolar protein family A [Capsaspora owczarzaki ATCC 30864]|eukprot:XP_004343588.1 nucleolar protein family A [Capsaspora owczarzaki ATCC 30864]